MAIMAIHDIIVGFDINLSDKLALKEVENRMLDQAFAIREGSR